MLSKFFNFIYIFFGLLLVSHYFSYELWSTTRGPLLIQLYTVFTWFYVLLKFQTVKKSYDSNYKIVIWLMVSCFITILFCATINTGEYSQQRSILLIFSIIPVYFFFKASKINKSELITASIIFVLVTLLIQVYQQLNFADPMFGLQHDYWGSAYSAERNNIFRFRIGIATLGEFCLCYYWDRICQKVSLKYIVLFILSAISVYLYLTRQYMVAIILTIFFSLFFIKNKKIRRWGFVGVLAFSFVLYIYYELLFKNLIELSETNTYSVDIRKIAYGVIFSGVFDNPVQWLTGHGHTFLESYEWPAKGIYTSDIGFVGQMYILGVLWIAIYFYTIYKYLWKKRNKTPLYLKLFLFCTLIHSPMVFPYTGISDIYVWMIALYLCSLEESKVDYGE